MKNNNIYTMKRGSRSVVSTTLAQAYIEHILSIYSAYIGTMWKPAGRLLRVAAMLCLLMTVGFGNAWGDSSYTWTMASGDLGTSETPATSASKGSPSKTWTVSFTWNDNTKKYLGFESSSPARGLQIGKGTAGYGSTKLVLSTTGISGTITSVTVNSAIAASGGATLSVKVGSTDFICNKKTTASPTTTATDYEFTGSASGTIEITLQNNVSNKGMYIKSIAITYTAASCTTSPTVTAGSNSSVTKNSARVTCSSGISSLGSAGCSITSYGFVLGTSSNPTTSNTTYEVGTSYASTGVSFYKDITGLSAGTTYYVRPYATNGNGTAYGTQTSFTTLFEASITLSKNNSDVSGSSNGSAKAVENATSLSSLSAPTRTGHHVEGYYTTSECETKVADDAGKFIASITVSGNTWTNSSKQWKRNNSETFYAKWTVNSYSVRFNKNDAGLINSATGSMSNESYDYGESKALTSCGFSVVGYDFSGWATTSGGLVAYSDGQTVSNLSTADGATVDLYAKWTIKTYTVTWKVNDASWTPNTTTGKGTDGTPNVNHGSAITTMPTAPSTDDFCGDKFMGWTDAANGEYTHGTSNLYTKVSDFPNITSGDVIYYAVFADYAE